MLFAYWNSFYQMVETFGQIKEKSKEIMNLIKLMNSNYAKTKTLTSPQIYT